MVKADRVKKSTKTFKKRKGFATKESKSVNIDVNNVNVNTETNSGEKTPPSTPSKEEEPVITDTVSHSKIQEIVSATPKSSGSINGYRIIDVSILKSIFELMRCPECTASYLTLQEIFEKKKGLASFLVVKCTAYDYAIDFYTSQTLKDGVKGQNSFDVNTRITYTMRACGQGHSGIEKFTTLMDMPRPMTQNNYDKIINKLTQVEAMCRYCKGCNNMEETRLKDPIKYESCKEKHNCNFNYKGSAGGMEPEGARRIFSRSVEKHNVRYAELYGDGDSKSHVTVENIYPGIQVKKLQ